MDCYYGLLKRSAARFVVCCIAAFVPAFLFAAQKPTTESTQGTFSGDYVIYRDYSWKAPTWIGFLYYNDETYGAFIRTDDPVSGFCVAKRKVGINAVIQHMMSRMVHLFRSPL